MKIDLSQTFVNADDSPAIDTVTKKPVDLKTILIQVLLSEVPGDHAEKVKKYGLYRDVTKSKVGFVTWSVEDVALVKKTVQSTHATLVMGQVHEMLEREWQPPAPVGELTQCDGLESYE